MRFTTFRNIGIGVALFFVMTLGWCTCHSGSPASRTTATVPVPTVTYVPVQATPPVQYQNPNTYPTPAPVYAPTPAPQVAAAIPDPNSLRAAAQAWLSTNPRGYNEMRRPTVIAGIRATAIRFPAADARKFTDNEADWNQLRFDFNGDGRDDEKWLIKQGQITKREQLGPDGKTVVGDPIFF